MPRRYHPALVALHWLTAALILGALAAGTFLLAPVANDDPAKMLSFRLHMGVGIVVLVLLVLRLVVRLTTAHPAPAETGSPVLNRGARVVHWALYGLALAMAASGVALSVTSGLPDAVFGSAALPPDFSAYPARAVHGVVATLLMLAILAHVGAALWHHYGRRDGLMARMWFGPR